MIIPTFLVVGAARAGTTGLVEGLRTHPQVFLTTPKEPHYFALHGTTPDFRGPGDAETINRVSVTDEAGYRALYPTTGDFLALGDGSVSTLYYAERAAAEIVRVNPKTRIVVILREPVERAYSSYLYLRARGFEPSDDFLRAVADEPRRRTENWHHLWHYTAMSRYADGVATLREAVGPDRVGVWFYDDLQAEYEHTIRSILRFLDLPPHPLEGLGVPRVNVSGTPRLPAVQHAIALVTGSNALRQTAKRLTSFRFRERIRRASLRRSEVPAEARRQLEPVFTADLARVAAMLPGPLPTWMGSHGQPDQGAGGIAPPPTAT